MAKREAGHLDADALSEVILSHCMNSEEGALSRMLCDALRHESAAVRVAVRRPDVQVALALLISTAQEESHSAAAMLLRTLRQADPAAAAEVARECDVAALARSISYAMEYGVQQVLLLSHLYTCNPEVGRRVFARCGDLMKEFVSKSSFPHLDLPEEFIAHVRCWKRRA